MCSDSYPISILSLFFLYHPYILYLNSKNILFSTKIKREVGIADYKGNNRLSAPSILVLQGVHNPLVYFS